MLYLSRRSISSNIFNVVCFVKNDHRITNVDLHRFPDYRVDDIIVGAENQLSFRCISIECLENCWHLVISSLNLALIMDLHSIMMLQNSVFVFSRQSLALVMDSHSIVMLRNSLLSQALVLIPEYPCL